MATDLQPRTTSRSANHLQRKFAELCARIRRVDLLWHVLILALVIVGYSFVVGTFDWLVGLSSALWVDATRWTLFGLFLIGFLFAAVRTIQCLFQRVNPYYVARELERTLPNAKNSLINWLDLADEDIPSAFYKNLSARADEQMDEADAEQTIRSQKNWVLLVLLALPTVGLLVLLLLSPATLVASLLRGFAPFYSPPVAARTNLTLLQPAGGDAEVGPQKEVAFAASIEGRVPAVNRPDSPRLQYRYQSSEDFRTLPLSIDPTGAWTAVLPASEVRTGFTYKISAGDAETPEHQIRLRGPAHVSRYEIAYRHKPYRNIKNGIDHFPNERAAVPLIHGPRGSEVEMVVHPSRAVKSARVELTNPKRELPIQMIDARTFSCKLTLETSGQFRVLFTTTDGEENTDRDWRSIQVRDDENPTVVLTQPGKDVTLPENAALELAGVATSDVGLKSLSLHVRVPGDKTLFPPKVYRPGKTFQFDDGTFPAVMEYVDFLALDELKDAKGTAHFFPAGTVIEYWLEATDGTDVPSPTGRIGKSALYKIVLSKPQDASKAAAQKKAASDRSEKHAAKQDNDQAKKNSDAKNKQGAGSTPDPQQALNQAQRENNAVDQKLNQAQKEQQQNSERGSGKGADEKNAENKPGPQPGDSNAPQEKKGPPMTGDDAGASKDGPGQSGAAKDSGTKSKKDKTSHGDSKPGPKEAKSDAKDAGPKGSPDPSAGVKDGGDMGMNAPMPAPAKDQITDAGAPMPIAKKSAPEQRPDGPPQGASKGIEQNGPDLPNKDAVASTQPPNLQSKGGGMMADAGAPRDNPEQPGIAGQTRDDAPKAGKQEMLWPDLAKVLEQLPNDDASGDMAAKTLKDIANNSSDPRKRDLAKEILAKNGRDPKTGEKIKGPNLTGSKGKSSGLTDDVKATVANREFAAKIGQMQLDDWRKRLTPELLKKAGLSEADWQRYLKNAQSYDALVRQLNAKTVRDAQKRGAGTNFGGALVESANPTNSSLDNASTPPPPEILDAERRFKERPK